MLDEDPTLGNQLTRVFRPNEQTGRAEIRVSRAADIDDDTKMTIARLNVTINDLTAENEILRARVRVLEQELEAPR
ncbi:MAG: hypothetical protein WAT66_12990 [Actinomycetota bacterium]